MNVKDGRGSTFTVTRDLSIHCPYFIYARKNYATVEIYRKAIQLIFKLIDLHHTATSLCTVTIHFANPVLCTYEDCFKNKLKVFGSTGHHMVAAFKESITPLLFSSKSPMRKPGNEVA